MISILENVLTKDEVKAIRRKLELSEFSGGEQTAGAQAVKVKKNLQLSDQKLAAELATGIFQAMGRSTRFADVAFPVQVTLPLFSVYKPDMEYGSHVDNALMGFPSRIRSDIAATLWLSEPEEYVGGELVINDNQPHDQALKLNAGSMVLYPASTSHHVECIREGTRYAAVFWVQSMVRDPAEREILVSLKDALTDLEKLVDDSAVLAPVLQSYQNLVRMWTEI